MRKRIHPEDVEDIVNDLQQEFESQIHRLEDDEDFEDLGLGPIKRFPRHNEIFDGYDN